MKKIKIKTCNNPNDLHFCYGEMFKSSRFGRQLMNEFKFRYANCPFIFDDNLN